jgi:Bacterial transglutaminase-like cysteine proteinase BTLCP
LAENKYSAIVKEARPKEPYPKVDFVQVRINHEIQYVPDYTQWGKVDRWSLPVDGEGKGSLNTGIGDCEDYVLAKYLVLLDALYPYKSMRILLVCDTFVSGSCRSGSQSRWEMADPRQSLGPFI